MELSAQVKAIARENGSALVGIASRERLMGAPPSADTDYLLPSTQYSSPISAQLRSIVLELPCSLPPTPKPRVKAVDRYHR